MRLDTTAKVAGEDFSKLKTARLDVQAYQFVARFDADADTSSGFLDFGDADDFDANDDAGRYRPRRTIFWETTVFLLGEPNPVLEVDQNGIITFKTWNVYVKAFNPSTNTYSGLLDVGNAIPAGSWIVVGDLIYDETGFVKFDTNDSGEVNSHAGGSDDNESIIFGNAGEFYVQDTWDTVTLTNYSDRRFVINDIDVVSDANDPEIQVHVDDIKGPTNAPANGDRSQDDDPAGLQLAENNPATFEFDILHKFPPTDVQIRNLQPGAIAASDIWLDGRIENPIGRTYVKNQRGNIFADNANDLNGSESTGVTLIGGHLVAIFVVLRRGHRRRADPHEQARARRGHRFDRTAAGRGRPARRDRRRARPVQAPGSDDLPRRRDAVPVPDRGAGRGGGRPRRST